MGAIDIAETGPGTGLEHTDTARAFTILRAPDAEPAALPLIPVRAAPVPAPAVPRVAVPGAGAAGPAPGEAPARQPGAVRAVHPDAHRFVLSTLRPMFEVLDRRRPAKHLTTIATGTVVDVLRVLADAGPPATVTGWGRVHVAAPRAVPPKPRAGAGAAEVGAEIFLTYSRGDRVLAAAGRVESVAGRWRWVAFTTAA